MKPRVIMVPYDSGHYRKRMGCGPERIFEGGLKNLLTAAHSHFECELIALDNTHPAEISAAFELARKIAERVRDCRACGEFPIVLSGNCNAAVGTVSGCGADQTAIVWFDAHGEATTPETTNSGFLDGMPISTLLGRAWQALAKSVPGFLPIPGQRILLFGARRLEDAEVKLLDAVGVHRLTRLEELKKLWPASLKDVEEIYLHVDLDVLDPSEATANQRMEPNGITLQTLLNTIATVRTNANIAALGIASFDPAADVNGRALAAALQVVELVLRK